MRTELFRSTKAEYSSCTSGDPAAAGRNVISEWIAPTLAWVVIIGFVLAIAAFMFE